MRQAVVLGVFALLCASLATGPALLAVEAPAKAGPATAAASDPEALAFRKVCGGCHSVSMFDSEPRGRAEWMETLKVMFERGAGGTDEEIDDVVRYLEAYAAHHRLFVRARRGVSGDRRPAQRTGPLQVACGNRCGSRGRRQAA